MRGRSYTVSEIKTSEAAWEHLKETFLEPCDYKLNWLFLSTDGIHGSPLTLNDLQEIPVSDRDITFLVVNPRMCRIFYGTLDITTEEETDWLMSVVKKTMDGVLMSQLGNLDRNKGVIDRAKHMINFVAARDDDFLGICNVPSCTKNAVEMVEFEITKNKSDFVPVFLCKEHFDAFEEE
jgi:hypothetical protein